MGFHPRSNYNICLKTWDQGVVFCCGRRGDCEEAIVIIPVDLTRGTPSSCCSGEVSSYLRGAALKTVVGLFYMLVLLKLLCLFILLYVFGIFLVFVFFTNNSSSQITSSFFSEALKFKKKAVGWIVGQVRLEGSLEANLD